MITKEERERDLAICEAARRVGGAKYEASTGHAAERLPLYIADAAEMERRIKEAEARAAPEPGEDEDDFDDTDPDESYGAGYREGMREVLRILRGEP